MYRLLSSSVLMVLAVSVFAAPRVAVPLLAQAPSVDGTLADGEWDGAAQITGLQDNTSRQMAQRQMRVLLGYDDAGIHLAMVSPVGNVPTPPEHELGVLAGQYARGVHRQAVWAPGLLPPRALPPRRSHRAGTD